VNELVTLPDATDAIIHASTGVSRFDKFGIDEAELAAAHGGNRRWRTG